MLNLTIFETVYLGMSVSLVVIGYLNLTSFMSFQSGLEMLLLCAVLLLLRQVVDK